MALLSKLSSKKRETRKSLSQPGWITLEGGFAARQCVVQDLSTTGAKVTIEDPNSLPAKLRLAFSRDARTGRRCEVVWRRGKSVGVKFVRLILVLTRFLHANRYHFARKRYDLALIGEGR